MKSLVPPYYLHQQKCTQKKSNHQQSTNKKENQGIIPV
jgi:hypothetical protein